MLKPVTCEDLWIETLTQTPRWQPPLKPTVVIVPHPDDEVLGVGGLIAEQCRRGAEVLIIAVTDGENAYPGVGGLASIRRLEQRRALETLGVKPEQIVRLSLPDSGVSQLEHQLTDRLLPFLSANTLVMAPWGFDFHPDHESCARAALRASKVAGAELVSYLFWAWHRGGPELLTQERVVRFDMDDRTQIVKAAALAEHQSQLEQSAIDPILPSHLLGPARRSFETFVLTGQL